VSHADPGSPRVAVLGQGWFPDDPGGLNRYVRDLLEAFSADGEPLTAMALSPATGAPANVTLAAAAGDPLPRRLRRYHVEAARICRDADVVDAHFALYALAPFTAGPARRLGRVMHFHGPWADEVAQMGRGGRASRSARAAIERATYRQAHQVIVLSRAFKRLAVERYGVKPERVSVVAPGVDLVRFAPGPRQQARQHLHLPQDRPIAVCVRRLDPRMGLLVLLDAWATIVRELSEPPLLLIAGVGPLRDELDRRTTAPPLRETVRLLGRVEDGDLPLLYRAADVSIVPSLSNEGFGLVTLESLACGTAVVATDVGGLPEALDGLDGDAIVSAGDAGGLARRVVRGLACTQPLPSPSACRAHAERFGWDAAVARHREIYRWAAAARHG